MNDILWYSLPIADLLMQQDFAMNDSFDIYLVCLLYVNVKVAFSIEWRVIFNISLHDDVNLQGSWEPPQIGLKFPSVFSKVYLCGCLERHLHCYLFRACYKIDIWHVAYITTEITK